MITDPAESMKSIFTRPVPPYLGGLGISVSLIPCQRGMLEMPSRLPSPNGVLAIIPSISRVRKPDSEKISLLLATFTLYIRVQSITEQKFAFGIASRIISVNGNDEPASEGAVWVSAYAGDTSIHPSRTIEDFATIPSVPIEIRPNRRVVSPGANAIVQRIEAWQEGDLLSWFNMIHNVTVEV